MLARLAIKAFHPAPVPFPLLHVDTTWKFKDMYAFREKFTRENGLRLIVHVNQEGLKQNVNPFTHLAVTYQEVLFFPGPVGHWRWLLALGAASIGVFLAGYWLFDRLRDSFAEVV